jgi:hypothetical protein
VPLFVKLFDSPKFIPAAEGGCAKNTSFWLWLRGASPHKPAGENIAGTADLASRKVNGFWVEVCQVVLISESVLAENPIDCRIFFADNLERKTESGIGGKNP